MALFVKVLTKVPRQEKFVQAGPVACWLWVAGLCYARDGSTDGFIPKLIVPTLVPELKGPYKHAARLVSVGLWEDAIGGYLIHDYLDENPSRAELEVIKAKDRDRKRDHVPSGIQTESQVESKRSPRAGASSPSPSGSAGSGFSGESAREPGASRPAPLIDGRDVRRHGSHAWCDWERGLCVQPGQHAEFIRRLGGEDADARLRAWYPTVIAKYAGRPIGDDVFAFWNHEFAAWVGTVTTRPATVSATPDRAAKTLTAAEKVIQRQLDTRQRALTP